MALVFALVTGTAIGLQAPVNSLLSKNIGLLEGGFFVLLIGTVCTGVPLLLGLGNGDLRRLAQTPAVGFLGGPIGVIIVVGIVLTVSRLGVVAGAAAIIVVQLSVSAAIDHFGFLGVERHPASVWTFAGIGMLVLGAVIIRW